MKVIINEYRLFNMTPSTPLIFAKMLLGLKLYFKSVFELEAIHDLTSSANIIIKPAKKGGKIVV